MKASVVNTELNLKVKRVILMIFSIDVKCFLQFACTNLDGSQKEGITFYACFRKTGVPRKGRVTTLKETMYNMIYI